MNKNETTLSDLLNERGLHHKRVYYEWDIPGARFSGWYMEDNEGNEFKLGSNLKEAKANVQIKKLEKVED